MIARQAIMNGQQAVVGYELFNRSRSTVGHTAASDVILVFTALSHAGTEELVGKMLIFVNCTHESLTGGHLELVNPDKVVLEIPPLGHVAAAEVHARLPILQALRSRGFHLAFNHTVLESTYAPWLPLADYIKLDMSVLARDQLAVLINYAGRHSQAELIAESSKPRNSTTWCRPWAWKCSRATGSRVPRWGRPNCSPPARRASCSCSTWCAARPVPTRSKRSSKRMLGWPST